MGIDYNKRPPSGGAASSGSPSAAGGLKLSKVTLTKSAPTVSLTKSGSASGQLRVNLNWNARPAGSPGGGFFKRMSAAAQPGIDLDLGCLYEFADGSKGVVQALGNAFYSQDFSSSAPIITLDGDDRSGTNSGGENLRIDLSRVGQIRRILVFALIYEGVPNWAAADGVVTLYPSSGAPIEVRMDESDPRAPMCAIALLTNNGGDLSVHREVRYIHGAQDKLDRAYGWGMQWSAGRK